MANSSAASSSSVRSIAGEPPPKKQRCRDLEPLSSPSSSSLLLLPDEILLNILARVPRRYYPMISLVSTTFRRLIASREIYIYRSILRCTERVLYVALRSHSTETPRWYTLNFKPFGNKSINQILVPILSFPSIPCWGMSIVAIDSEIYVLGGCIDNELVSTGFVVECASHTCRYLPSMKQARGGAAVGFVDGKLYVIGGCNPQSLNWVEAFDLKTQSWETVLGVHNVEIRDLTIRSFVIDDKIYIMDRKTSFVYDPKKGRLERDVLLDINWRVGSCVIDGRLYTFCINNEIWVFDPIARVWDRLKGLDDLPEKPNGSRMSNLGGNLAIVFNYYLNDKFSTEICCAEIKLERREGGKMWGTILWANTVITLKGPSAIVRCLTVPV